MKDVARAAGVSTATVSATLSGASFVSSELKTRVTTAIAALGYERNSMASGLKLGRTGLIGLIVSDITNPFFTELVHSVQIEARNSGYSLLLGVSDFDTAREAELLRFMRSHQAEGTILSPAGAPIDAIAFDSALGRMKLVAVDNAAPELPLDTVVLDNSKAAELATGHLLSLGHRRIAVMVGPSHQYVSQLRLEGYRQSLAAYGIAADPALIRRGDFRIEDAYRACRGLLELPQPPTALFVANNLMLIGVMQALSEAGVSVPRDMSVASIDDFPWAPAFQPALTVVRQPIARMATAALARLLLRMNGDSGAPVRQVLEPELIVRQSCAPPGNRS